MKIQLLSVPYPTIQTQSHSSIFNPTFPFSIPLSLFQSHSLCINPTLLSVHSLSHYYSSCIYPICVDTWEICLLNWYVFFFMSTLSYYYGTNTILGSLACCTPSAEIWL